MKKMARWLILTNLWLCTAVAQAGTHHYYYTDPQGTVLAKADATGTIIATYDYAPYGAAVASMSPAPNGPGYTGHVNDPDTGLVYMQARYYDPTTGRFLSTDLVGPASGNAFNFNRYAYASNNPIVNIDPNGRQSEDAVRVEEDYVAARDASRFMPAVQPVSPIISAMEAAGNAEANEEILNPGAEAQAFNDAVNKIIAPRADPTPSTEPQTSDRKPGSDGKRGSTGGPGAGKLFKPEPPNVRAEKEGTPCVYCGTPTTNTPGRPNSRERDHIDPKSRGGNNTPENERDSCRTCNRRKSSKNPDEMQQ